MADPHRNRELDKINLRCGFCGNAKRVVRWKHDPADAVELEMNECGICHAATGGFEEGIYYDRRGAQVGAVS